MALASRLLSNSPLKDFKNKESEVLSRCIVEYAILDAEVSELAQMLQNDVEGYVLNEILDHCLDDAKERLYMLKKVFTSKLSAVLLLQRKLDDIPVPSELLQYEACFSQLYTSIQRKLQQTRKYYGTYNALLELKEMMLKEISLMNSISSQNALCHEARSLASLDKYKFQIAISSPIGRTKLLESMEGILQGIQQKVEKQQLVLESEQKACEALEEKHRKALSEQRQCFSLLKAFQDDCARNETLRRGQT